MKMKDGPDRRVTLLSEPNSCFSSKWGATFCREMQEKLARPG